MDSMLGIKFLVNVKLQICLFLTFTKAKIRQNMLKFKIFLFKISKWVFFPSPQAKFNFEKNVKKNIDKLIFCDIAQSLFQGCHFGPCYSRILENWLF